LSPTGEAGTGIEDKTNARSMETGGVRGTHISEATETINPVQKLNDKREPVYENGLPVYIDEKAYWCVILWHELVGHSIAGLPEHDKDRWNNYENRDKSVPNWGTEDPTIAIENQYRKLRGLPLRRPQYYDREHPPKQ
jgi:hypothetical protein